MSPAVSFTIVFMQSFPSDTEPSRGLPKTNICRLELFRLNCLKKKKMLSDIVSELF